MNNPSLDRTFISHEYKRYYLFSLPLGGSDNAMIRRTTKQILWIIPCEEKLSVSQNK